jgi:NADPH:quinone reductase-like Zn-dependent oxidoreductase
MARSGALKTKVERTYPLSEAKPAIARALEGKREGKILFKM